MTDTIVKPLEWENAGQGDMKAKTPFGEYFCLRTFADISVLSFNGKEISRSSIGSHEKSREMAFGHHETLVLSALNLEAYRAQIRAEALEEAAQVAETAPYKRRAMVCGCSEGLSNYTAASIRTLIEKGEEDKTTWEQRHGWDEHG